jgi:hypothetical protein
LIPEFQTFHHLHNLALVGGHAYQAQTTHVVIAGNNPRPFRELRGINRLPENFPRLWVSLVSHITGHEKEVRAFDLGQLDEAPEGRVHARQGPENLGNRSSIRITSRKMQVRKMNYSHGHLRAPIVTACSS